MKKTYEFLKEKDLYYIIGNNVKYYRKLYSLNEKELTQECLAELANISTSLLGNKKKKKIFQVVKKNQVIKFFKNM